MFTGIIEAMGTMQSTETENSNVHFRIKAPFTSELKIDQSVAHNGVCLTVVAIEGDEYLVTAIEETLQKTNLGSLATGSKINLERCMKLGDRLDGHLVQGHVDQTAICDLISDENGSWKFGFRYDEKENVTVSKGSICINGVSLTVVDSSPGYFSVAIIPYTYEHTNFSSLKKGDTVNLEFDIVGKYIARLMQR
ncbi:MAG TPA: riboflavin synthase [Flavobacteriales bacterium]|nr:riboflavin synthase [Flavobacteriales bacterium]HCA82939.1 riboflavin synthase [Flavobacteriales bacterium]HRE73862.1 riboflavin synthase [Flavobacteriales bacterium]HRE98397.1 riboflavin synthase [Flavobacteriales bacterium]HRJ34519.1 riboflavin synthase [Flavobacteriales bacterium]